MTPVRRAAIVDLLRRRPEPAAPALTCRRHDGRAPEARPLDCAHCLVDLQAEIPRLFAALGEQVAWIREAQLLLVDIWRRRDCA